MILFTVQEDFRRYNEKTEPRIWNRPIGSRTRTYSSRSPEKPTLDVETISGLGNLSPRFLSEFERGKETAEIGKILKALRTMGLEVVIQPRGATPSSKISESEKKTDE